MSKRPEPTYDQLKAELAEMVMKFTHQSNLLTVRNNELKAAQETIAALGWQRLTADTEWEEGSMVGRWYLGNFQNYKWVKGHSAHYWTIAGYNLVLRLSPPAKERES